VTAELGRLIDVPLREAWRHEAHGFTPWLADNLDQLGDALGLPLELEATEVKVDAFSADILARNPSDNSHVLIENQLAGTDHTHLGQIMTYLAGLEARSVVWVAADFREAHLSAINWLNEHTVEPFAFFAVKVKVVRIGESPLAPLFEVLARPNGFERQLHAVARSTEDKSELGQFRHDFWTHYVDRFAGEAAHGPANAASARWREVPGTDLYVVLFVGRRVSGLFLRGPRGAAPEDVWDQLAPHAERIADATGADSRSYAANGHFLGKGHRLDLTDRTNWDAMCDWMHENAERYRAELEACLGDAS